MPPGRPRHTVLGMTRSAVFAVLFEVVMPALGLALVLGASLVPAVAVAAVASAAIFAVMRGVSP